MRLALTVRGAVQGVGFRPWVLAHARRLELSGWVRNSAGAAALELQGAPAQIDALVKQIGAAPPPIAVLEIESRSLSEEPMETGFRIVDSEAQDPGPQPSPLAPDLRLCAECEAECLSGEGRRRGYALIGCARCGPRYSIARGLPFDRERTSYAAFRLCAPCQREYDDPSDRRHHAQTIACSACGPDLHFDAHIKPQSISVAEREWAAAAREASGLPAVEAAAALLRAGRILGLLGVGGFQLLCDATNSAAVACLRRRKQRPSKPLAVLFRDLEQVEAYGRLSQREAKLLAGPAGPIVLLDQKAEPSAAGGRSLCEEVAPGTRRLGALLPTSAAHAQLARLVGRPLICTSGNRSGEPLVTAVREARQLLSSVVDGWLWHEREVKRPLDDSVAQQVAGETQLLRRARGYVPGPGCPLPRARSQPSPVLLAVGGQLKASVTLAATDSAWTGPHLGDLETVGAQSRFVTNVEDWLQLHGARPTAIACDLHPGYASTRLAQALAKRFGASLHAVQHHEAHLAACLAEHHETGPALGLAWDGAGLGHDGSLWGGEAFSHRGGVFRRVAHLRPFPLPGGEQAMREPRRSALGLLQSAGWREAAEEAGLFEPRQLELVWQATDRGINAPMTSSVGRLFDAAAALAGLRLRCTHEGQAAAEWMSAAERAPARVGAYPLPLGPDGVVDHRPLVAALLEDGKKRVALEVRARRFHEACVELAVALAERFDHSGQVLLGGGCFQNRLLVSRLLERLGAQGRRVLWPQRFPPGDGGLSLGQAWMVWRRLLGLCGGHEALESRGAPDTGGGPRGSG